MKTYPVEGILGRDIRAIKSDEFRCPKKGEYYLSGAIPMAYKAPNDLSMEFYIARLVKVETVTEERIVEYL